MIVGHQHQWRGYQSRTTASTGEHQHQWGTYCKHQWGKSASMEGPQPQQEDISSRRGRQPQGEDVSLKEREDISLDERTSVSTGGHQPQLEDIRLNGGHRPRWVASAKQAGLSLHIFCMGHIPFCPQPAWQTRLSAGRSHHNPVFWAQPCLGQPGGSLYLFGR